MNQNSHSHTNPELAMIADVLDRVKYQADTDQVQAEISVGELRAICQAALRPSVLGGPHNDGTAHIDHPLRHFDRTCLACWQESEAGADDDLQAELVRLKQWFEDRRDRPGCTAQAIHIGMALDAHAKRSTTSD